MRRLVAAMAAARLLSAPSVLAGYDGTYYPAGVQNPLVKQDLYYKNAIDVVEHLDAFESLFVEYHSCTWSASSASNEDDINEEERNDEDLWYQGAVPVRQANVAYSLYGVKRQSDGASRSKTSGCRAETFINSFVTTSSFQAFTDSLSSAGAAGFAQQQDDDDGDASSSYEICSDDGYGVGCLSGSFVYNSYSQNENGRYVCDEYHVLDVVDNMESMNGSLEATSCFEIYSAQSADSNNGDGWLPAETLLTYSEDCSVNDPEITCPDPHGVLGRYETAFSRGAYQESKEAVSRMRTLKAWGMVGLSLLFLLAAFLTILEEVKYRRSLRARASRLARDSEIVERNTFSDANDSRSTGTASTGSNGGESHVDAFPVCKSESVSMPKPPIWSRFRLGRTKRGERTQKAAMMELPGLLSYEPASRVEQKQNKLPVSTFSPPVNSTNLVRASSHFELQQVRDAFEIEVTSDTLPPSSPFASPKATAIANEAFRGALSSETSSLVSVPTDEPTFEDNDNAISVLSGLSSFYQAATKGMTSLNEIPGLMQAASMVSMAAQTETPFSNAREASSGIQSVDESAFIGTYKTNAEAGISTYTFSEVADAIVRPLSETIDNVTEAGKAGVKSMTETGKAGIGNLLSVSSALAGEAVGAMAEDQCHLIGVSKCGFDEVTQYEIIDAAIETFDATPCGVVANELLHNENEIAHRSTKSYGTSSSYDDSALTEAYARSQSKACNVESIKDGVELTNQGPVVDQNWRKSVEHMYHFATVGEAQPITNRNLFAKGAASLFGGSGMFANQEASDELLKPSHASNQFRVSNIVVTGLKEHSPESSPEPSVSSGDVTTDVSAPTDHPVYGHSLASLFIVQESNGWWDRKTANCADQNVEVTHDPGGRNPCWQNPWKRNIESASAVVIGDNSMAAPGDAGEVGNSGAATFTSTQRSAEKLRVQSQIDRIRSIAGLEKSQHLERIWESYTPPRQSSSTMPWCESALLGHPESRAKKPGIGVQAYLKMKHESSTGMSQQSNGSHDDRSVIQPCRSNQRQRSSNLSVDPQPVTSLQKVSYDGCIDNQNALLCGVPALDSVPKPTSSSSLQASLRQDTLSTEPLAVAADSAVSSAGEDSKEIIEPKSHCTPFGLAETSIKYQSLEEGEEIILYDSDQSEGFLRCCHTDVGTEGIGSVGEEALRKRGDSESACFDIEDQDEGEEVVLVRSEDSECLDSGREKFASTSVGEDAASGSKLDGSLRSLCDARGSANVKETVDIGNKEASHPDLILSVKRRDEPIESRSASAEINTSISSQSQAYGNDNAEEKKPSIIIRSVLKNSSDADLSTSKHSRSLTASEEECSTANQSKVLGRDIDPDVPTGKASKLPRSNSRDGDTDVSTFTQSHLSPRSWTKGTDLSSALQSMASRKDHAIKQSQAPVEHDIENSADAISNSNRSTHSSTTNVCELNSNIVTAKATDQTDLSTSMKSAGSNDHHVAATDASISKHSWLSWKTRRSTADDVSTSKYTDALEKGLTESDPVDQAKHSSEQKSKTGKIEKDNDDCSVSKQSRTSLTSRKINAGVSVEEHSVPKTGNPNKEGIANSSRGSAMSMNIGDDVAMAKQPKSRVTRNSDAVEGTTLAELSVYKEPVVKDILISKKSQLPAKASLDTEISIANDTKASTESRLGTNSTGHTVTPAYNHSDDTAIQKLPLVPRLGRAKGDDVSLSKQPHTSAEGVTESSVALLTRLPPKSRNESVAEPECLPCSTSEPPSKSSRSRERGSTEQLSKTDREETDGELSSAFDVKSTADWKVAEQNQGGSSKERSVKSGTVDGASTTTETRTLASKLFGKKTIDGKKSSSLKLEPQSLTADRGSALRYKGKPENKAPSLSQELLQVSPRDGKPEFRMKMLDVVDLKSNNSILASEESARGGLAKVETSSETEDDSFAEQSLRNVTAESKKNKPVSLLSYMKIRDEHITGATSGLDNKISIKSTKPQEHDLFDSHTGSILPVKEQEIHAQTKNTTKPTSRAISKRIGIFPFKTLHKSGNTGIRDAEKSEGQGTQLASMQQQETAEREVKKTSPKSIKSGHRDELTVPIDSSQKKTNAGDHCSSSQDAKTVGSTSHAKSATNPVAEVVVEETASQCMYPTNSDADAAATSATTNDVGADNLVNSAQFQVQGGKSESSTECIHTSSHGSIERNTLDETQENPEKMMHVRCFASEKDQASVTISLPEALEKNAETSGSAVSVANSKGGSAWSPKMKSKVLERCRKIQFLDSTSCDGGVELVDAGTHFASHTEALSEAKMHADECQSIARPTATLKGEVDRILGVLENSRFSMDKELPPPVDAIEDDDPLIDHISLAHTSVDSKIGRHIQVNSKRPSSSSLDDADLTDSGSEASMTRASKSTVRRLNEFTTLHTTPVARSRAVRSTLVNMDKSKEQIGAEVVNVEGLDRKHRNLKKKKWMRNYAKHINS